MKPKIRVVVASTRLVVISYTEDPRCPEQYLSMLRKSSQVFLAAHAVSGAAKAWANVGRLGPFRA